MHYKDRSSVMFSTALIVTAMSILFACKTIGKRQSGNDSGVTSAYSKDLADRCIGRYTDSGSSAPYQYACYLFGKSGETCKEVCDRNNFKFAPDAANVSQSKCRELLVALAKVPQSISIQSHPARYASEVFCECALYRTAFSGVPGFEGSHYLFEDGNLKDRKDGITGQRVCACE